MGTVYPLGVGVAENEKGSVYQRRHIGIQNSDEDLFSGLVTVAGCIYFGPAW